MDFLSSGSAWVQCPSSASFIARSTSAPTAGEAGLGEVCADPSVTVAKIHGNNTARKEYCETRKLRRMRRLYDEIIRQRRQFREALLLRIAGVKNGRRHSSACRRCNCHRSAKAVLSVRSKTSEPAVVAERFVNR